MNKGLLEIISHMEETAHKEGHTTIKEISLRERQHEISRISFCDC